MSCTLEALVDLLGQQALDQRDDPAQHVGQHGERQLGQQQHRHAIEQPALPPTPPVSPDGRAAGPDARHRR
jgi:hypothetical protein